MDEAVVRAHPAPWNKGKLVGHRLLGISPGAKSLCRSTLRRAINPRK